jgi:hypothetical protein
MSLETVITRRSKAQIAAICRHPVGMPKRKQALRMGAMGASDDEN